MTEYAVRDPATGELVETFPTASDAEIAAAVDLAAAASAGWARSTTVADRVALLRRVGELHRERRAELADAIVAEMGKPVEDARGEIDFCVAIYDYYADNAETFLADEPVKLLGGDGSAVVRRSPVGVLLGIMPWNYPAYQVARFAAPNLALGNTILLKHAPQCPRSAALLERVFRDAGFPEGAYVNVYATNEQIAEIIADPRVRGVSLTGSGRAGAAVAEIAGRHLKKVVLELGGSDPFVLLSTDDLAAAVDSAVSARLENTGQACNAAKRFIVADELHDDFVSLFTRRLQAAASGAPLSSVAAAENLGRQVDRAVEQGATFHSSGKRQGGHFPTGVLTGVTPDHDVYHEELFGPVAIVVRAADEDDAVRIANDTPYGLGSYVFTTDADQAQRVAERIEAGMVFVNGVGADSAELPFGGVKASGFGRELGRSGIEEFVNKKLIRVVA
ncbi:NAD-dependent succinate-semialdehyde dehydrogenase [Spongiactinospora sp. TRM90649]|uniref:NAD-dependent succinate-semialdehyde dehydrogenase n=1 Tax=Spongiactinospora sp. TRM90649 TaxID=3031114 RepID=UPI0023F8075D|nr:NAD-dependent succinate-semialdehyde dehydrogenase [Spongiactinospora sp. TRM90649]MDF5755083.1 NAD-dependent succinate-semialdehyde dehydrogenase [Spongiactinospora sp. TRM90649]